ncbi:MAG TPA: hypothetical protein VEB21_20310 [Terriglobales bacterium]|nr:hypothetical protein [Terriglobales bacterium]
MARAGRELEKLVSILESHLGPRGVDIRSPDWLPDKVTGQRREVDVSLRYQVGSTPLLITIECRDRAAVEDKTWIEQLVQKRNDVGANATIAVSSAGFSAPAVLAAAHHQIEVRTLSEVSEDAVRDWAESLQMVALTFQFGLCSAHISLHSEESAVAPRLHAEVVAALETGLVDRPIMRRCHDQAAVSVGDLLDADDVRAGKPIFDSSDETVTIEVPPHSVVAAELKARFSTLSEGVPHSGETVETARTWEFAPGEVEILTTSGFASVALLEVGFRMRYFARPARLGTLLAYANADRALLNVGRFEAEFGPGKRREIIASSRLEKE